MRLVFYFVWLAIGIAAAPFVAFGIAVYTFFITFFAFIKGIHEGLIHSFFDMPNEAKQHEGVWDKHQRRLDEQNKNEK
jgi:hypothetical protein